MVQLKESKTVCFGYFTLNIMDFPKTLGKLKVAIDKELGYHFDNVIRDARKKDMLIADVLKQAKKITLAGGKRIRGALLCQAYFGAGGKEKKKILKVAAAIELVHLFLLIHDDIIDRGSLRHGEKTLHTMFSGKKQKNISSDKASHFGDSIAIIAGDMIYAMANKLIAESGFDVLITLQALSQIQSVAMTTIIGQSQDIAIAYKKKTTEKEVLTMYKNKTARYTFEGPLYAGAMLAGRNNPKFLQYLSRYAVPIGIAFQIQDDILGVFGSKKKMGKLTVSDIEEGKKSIMVVKACEWADSKQKKRLDSILGKKNLTNKEVKIFRDILKSTGALEYSNKMATAYFDKGKKEVKKIAFLPDAKRFLMELIKYLENRNI